MFYVGLIAALRSMRRVWPSALSATAILILAFAGQLGANHGVTNPKVQARIDLMTTQKYALSVLSEMASTRRPFDRQEARAARNTLKETTDQIPKRFQRPHRDPHSLAKPEIWPNWDDFKTRARNAHEAANTINIRSLSGLRRSLPALIQACHACHTTYKDAGHEFTTH